MELLNLLLDARCCIHINSFEGTRLQRARINKGGRDSNLSAHFAGLTRGAVPGTGEWSPCRILPVGVASGPGPLQPVCLTMGAAAHSLNSFLCFHGRINSKFQGSTKCLTPAHAWLKKMLGVISQCQLVNNDQPLR